MKQCYIWTALTQHIKPGEGGGQRWQRPVVSDILGHCINADDRGTCPTHTARTGRIREGGGGAVVYFGSVPGCSQTAGSEDESDIKNCFYFEGAITHQTECIFMDRCLILLFLSLLSAILCFFSDFWLLSWTTAWLEPTMHLQSRQLEQVLKHHCILLPVWLSENA